MSPTVLHIQAETSSLGHTWSSSSSQDSPAISKGTARGLLVCFKDVGFSIPAAGRPSGQSTVIIEGITGFFEPGQMTAVMGPSGSGKTTFVDILAGRKTAGSITGIIQYGGLPPSRRLLRRATGYVEQTDTLVDTLTCSEMLLYTAHLKRHRHESLASKQAAVETLISKLGLGSCSNTHIGSVLKRGISGGQAKRLNIGLSLITEPRVLYLDEPTSGLDSYMANEVMSAVSSLTVRDGITVAATIHSPSSYCFSLFDKLLVLAGGHMIYMGHAGDTAISYFTSSSCSARQPRLGDNLADWIIEAVTQADRQGGKGTLAELFRNSQQAEVLLQYRTLRNYRSPLYILPRVAEKLLFAAIVLSLYYGKGSDFSTMNVPVLTSLLFLMVLCPICSAIVYLPGMMTERALYIREHNDGLYRPITYLVFRLLEDLLLMAPVTAATTAAVFYGCSLRGSFLLFWLVHFATLANGTSLAYFLASISPGLSVAMPVLCFVMVVSLILCGFMIRVAAMPAICYYFALSRCANPLYNTNEIRSWAVKANVVHYSWGALLINQYKGNASGSRLGGMGVLSYFDLAGADAWMFLCIIVAFFFGWTFLAWLALAYARTHKR